MANNRGTADTVDMTQPRLLSGGAAAQQIVTTLFGTKVSGNLAAWQGNQVIDTGIAMSSVVTGTGGTSAVPPTPILDSATGQPILDDAGNWIFPG